MRRLPHVLCPSLMALAACGPPSPLVVNNYFPRVIASAPPMPPQDQLLLWLEGTNRLGGPYLTLNEDGLVDIWDDVRYGGRLIYAVEPDEGAPGRQRAGRRSSIALALPDGSTRRVHALSCGGVTGRCSYEFINLDRRDYSNALDETPFTIFAVVRRASGRGDQYAVMTSGRGCRDDTGIECGRNTALHVGWPGERTLRLGQYGNDVDLDAPSFAPGTISLIEATRGRGLKTIALLETTMNRAVVLEDPDRRLLHDTAQLLIGGTPFGIRRSQPNWQFDGDILAVLVYRKDLTVVERQQAQDYLRSRYGPRE